MPSPLSNIGGEIPPSPGSTPMISLKACFTDHADSRLIYPLLFYGSFSERCHFRGMKSKNFKMFLLLISFLIKKEVCLKIMKIMFGSIFTIISSTIFKIYFKAVLNNGVITVRSSPSYHLHHWMEVVTDIT